MLILLKNRSKISAENAKGFTLVELMVSIAIFALMTALVVTKYGSVNQSLFLTNLAYDVALTIRTAQTYGLSVRSKDDTAASYNSSYGVAFNANSTTITCAGSVVIDENQFLLYANIDETDKWCGDNDTLISKYSLKRGAKVTGVCIDASCTPGTGHLDVVFRRPSPQALICLNNTCNSTTQYAEVQVSSSDGHTRKITIRSNGQIAIPD